MSESGGSAARDLVRRVLASMGVTLTSTTFRFVPMVTDTATIGFVNVGTGVAVSTDIILQEDEIDALTLPMLAPGVYVSREAAASHPQSAKEFGAESVPEGWRQIFCDIRPQGSEADAEPFACSARVVRWGLVTTWGVRGLPGYQRLDETEWHGLARWRPPEEVAASFRATGVDWLRSVLEALAGELEVDLDPHDDPQDMLRRMEPSIPEDLSGALAVLRRVTDCGDSEGVAGHLRRDTVDEAFGVVPDWLGNEGVAYRVVARRMVSELLFRRLVDTATAVWSATLVYDQATHLYADQEQRAAAVLEAAVRGLLPSVLSHHVKGLAEARRAMSAACLGDSSMLVNIPHGKCAGVEV